MLKTKRWCVKNSDQKLFWTLLYIDPPVLRKSKNIFWQALKYYHPYTTFGKQNHTIAYFNKNFRKKKRWTIANVGEEVKKLESSYIAGWNVKWCSSFGKKLGSSSKG